ncbi:shikimate dehydrogenase [Aquamicrobium sp. LC103]|uniref:shikimate dehydrogenase family protein n=1 Tax=Aquamicrobium sp. LC103 TaxID=1120658 RepID=UPI00063EC568|nr:shikimate dehydrogenase [Aquamicrobium sp. LC103]TKT75866.1 shikimate dehydrogenase [Aquamicrobium sp. LC103]
MIKGSTRIVAIIGSPVAQVKSPENFNAAFAQSGTDVAMIAMDLAPEGVSDFLSMARRWKNLDGFVVTIPHKQAVAAGVDVITPRAALLGAANVVRREADGTLTGDMVDGLGFVEAARRNGFEPAGKRALVIGGGGAGSAIAHALCETGVASLALSDIDTARAERLAGLLHTEFPATEISTQSGDLDALDLVANATPLGMKQGDPLPLAGEALAELKASALVADVVTSPEVTPFLAAAQARGLSIQTGPQMAKAQLALLGGHMGVIDDAS